MLNRNYLIPSDELQKRIFPFIETELAKRTTQNPSGGTLHSFLTLLKNLRIIILQDVAVLMEQDRDHCIFKLPVFRSEMFMAFRQDMIRTISNVSNQRDADIDSVLPQLRQILQRNHQELLFRLNEQQDVLERQDETVNSFVTGTSSFLNGFVSDILLSQNQVIRSLNSAFTNLGSIQIPEVSGMEMQVVESASGLNDVPVELDRVSQPPPASENHYPAETDVNYRLYKNHQTFQSVWDEWFGLDAFSPVNNHQIAFTGGIKGLETNKKGWRKHFSTAENKLFSRTKFLIGYVESQDDARTALEQMDALFREHGRSVHSLEKKLKKLAQ